jgi:LmbE family N-acetylglucosaminyl deacetylase
MTELIGRALVVMAHPDDAEFGCAGTIAAWVRDGWHVTYVVCTDAAAGGPDEAIDVSPAARGVITAMRKDEQRAACAVLGVADVIFLDEPDGVLQPTLALRRTLVRIYRQVRPQRLVCQSPIPTFEPVYAIGRHHPDHLAAGTAAIAAMYPASQNPWDFPELLDEGFMPHKIRELYLMGAPNPNHAVDIAATLEQKLAALAAHTSQVGARMHELRPRMTQWAATAGQPFGLDAAEVFHRAENP